MSIKISTRSKKIPKELVAQRNRIVQTENRGEFWKPCPGTGDDYNCCGYQIITPLTGCGMYCSYCVLQEYHTQNHQVQYTNWDELEREVSEKMTEWEGVVRFGTGEFADSLYLEKKLGLSQKLAKFLKRYKNVLVEFKTKSTNIEPLKNIEDPSKVVIGFSMNTDEMISALEEGTAALDDRLKAASECERMGFWVAFHFDPMVWYPNWEKDYREVVDRIFSTIKNPQKIAWWSLGAFRTMPSLKKTLKKSGRIMPLFSGELVLGTDKKYRYIRSVRTQFFRVMQNQVEKYYPETTLYLCMESPEVWRDCGMQKRIPNGLTAYLDQRAEKMLELKK